MIAYINNEIVHETYKNYHVKYQKKKLVQYLH